MDNKKLDRIWAEIIEEGKKLRSERLEGEMTIYEFMDKTGLSFGQAKNRLNFLVRSGILSVRKKVYLQELRSSVNLYSPVIK